MRLDGSDPLVTISDRNGKSQREKNKVQVFCFCFCFHLKPWYSRSTTSYQIIAAVLPESLRRLGCIKINLPSTTQDTNIQHPWYSEFNFHCCIFRNFSAIQNWFIWGLHLWNWTKTWALQDSQVRQTGGGDSLFGGGQAHQCFCLSPLQTTRW